MADPDFKKMVLVAAAEGLQFGIMTTCNRWISCVSKDSLRGRAMSLYAITWRGFLPVGGLWLGILIATVGVTLGLTMIGVITIAFAAWTLKPGTRCVERRSRPL